MNFNNKYDIILLCCIYLSITCGIVTIYSQEVVLENPPERWFKQLIYVGIGTLFLLWLHRINYQYFSNYALPLYGISMFFLLITLIPGIGTEVNGARSWIRIGDIGFQSSELAKISTIILLTTYLRLKEKEMHQLSVLLIPFIIVVIPMLLILLQPDFGSAFSLIPVLLAILIIAGADMYHIAGITIFLFLSVTVPLYIEYNNIILVPALLEYLDDSEQRSLLSAVRILKTYVWKFAETATMPAKIIGQDIDYLKSILANETLMLNLQNSVKKVRLQSGGVFLFFLEQVRLLLTLGIVFVITALVLWGLQLARGVSRIFLRRLYIPLFIIGISFISFASLQKISPFRSHQVARITSFINSDKFAHDLAYQIRASKAAIGSGEFLGRGLWEGEMTMGTNPLVPESHTDFIFSSWAERTGFLGSLFLIFILIAIPLRGLFISIEARDRFGSLLASGISYLFCFHIIINVGIGLGLLPVTGLPLSFVSYGGSHLVVSMGCVGILLSIYRRRFAH